MASRRTTWVKGWGATSVLLAVLLFLSFAGNARADLAWSAPHIPVPNGVMQLNGVACPSATQCTAVDQAGQEVTFNPASPGHPTPVLIDEGGYLNAIACPSATECVATDLTGDALTFNPQGPVNPTLLNVGVTDGITGISCPATNQCTAVDHGGVESTFNPVAETVTHAAAFGQGNLLGVSCPSTTQCTALSGSAALTFAPATGTVSNGVAISGAGALSCPSTGECVTVGQGSNDRFDPNSTSSATLAGDQLAYPSAVTCPSAGTCVGLSGSTGSELTFSPGSNSQTPPTKLDTSAYLLSFACSASCVVVDAHGQVRTVDPATNAATSPAAIDTVAGLQNVACPSATQCTAATVGVYSQSGVSSDAQIVTFDPSTGTDTVAPAAVSPHYGFYALACASTASCTAPGFTDQGFTGYVFGFSPANPGAAVTDFTDYVSDVTCPAAGECVGLNSGHALRYDPGVPGGTPTSTTLPGYPSRISCPSATQCTAVGSGGGETTFNPSTGGTASAPVTVLPGSGDHYLSGIACPSTTQCTAVDSSTGTAVTFNPVGGTVISSGVVDLPAANLNRMACLSTSDCVAIDGYGFSVEGDPTQVSSWHIQRVSGADALKSIACPTSGECVVVDDAGREFTGVPGGASGNPVGGGGGGSGGGGGGGTPTTPSGTPAPGPPTAPSAPQNPPGFVESVTTSSGQTITITTALGQEGYAPLDQHLLGGLSANDIATLLANGGFTIQIPLTYPAYSGNYSASGSASPQGIPGYDSSGGGGGAPTGYTTDGGSATATSASASKRSGRTGHRAKTKAKPLAPVVLFRFSHTYTKAGVYRATIHFTAAGLRLLRAAQKAHKSLKVTVSLSLIAAGHQPFHQTLHTTLKPSRVHKAKPKPRRRR